MRYIALATDYDGTLAHDGTVDAPTLAALSRLRASRRRLILVTGRILDDLLRALPQIDLFDHVVAENGAVLYRPATREEVAIGERPPDSFVEALRARGVGPLAVGRVIVATDDQHEVAVRDTIREQALALQVILNKGAVMVLPLGIDKASGLAAALAELGLAPQQAVGVGDAENDRALLMACGCGVAVANALPALKQCADLVTAASYGAGVAELIDHMIRDDLVTMVPHPDRQT